MSQSVVRYLGIFCGFLIIYTLPGTYDDVWTFQYLMVHHTTIHAQTMDDSLFYDRELFPMSFVVGLCAVMLTRLQAKAGQGQCKDLGVSPDRIMTISG